MPNYAVVARADKELGGGLDELRQVLAEVEVDIAMWRELPAGADVGDSVREVVNAGADLVLVWGGDGTVQRSVDALAGTDVAMAIMPAGGGNLLARDLGVPIDVRGAVDVAVGGERRRIDTIVADDEHFAMVAGAGLSSLLMRDHHRKNISERIQRVGRLGLGALRLRARPIRGTVVVDGKTIYSGDITCVLVSNIAEAVAGIAEFDEPEHDDGLVEIGIVGSRRVVEWARGFARVLLGKAEESPFTVTELGRTVELRFSRLVDFELDGSPKDDVRTVRIRVRPRSVTVCVPEADPADSATPSR